MNNKDQILQEIKQAVLSVDPQAEVVLFGSRARGDYREESDWDVLVLVEKEQNDWRHKEKILNAVFGVELKNKQVITPIIRNKVFWDELEVTLLHKEIEKDGIII
ncbi:MAG: polymerase subunit beta [Segetibacter sp.]|nr:polymerase subunit beta [Segetibacter sp.]